MNYLKNKLNRHESESSNSSSNSNSNSDSDSNSDSNSDSGSEDSHTQELEYLYKMLLKGHSVKVPEYSIDPLILLSIDDNNMQLFKKLFSMKKTFYNSFIKEFKKRYHYFSKNEINQFEKIFKEYNSHKDQRKWMSGLVKN